MKGYFLSLKLFLSYFADEMQHTSRPQIVQGWLSTDGIHIVRSMIEIWIPVLGGQTTTDADLQDFHGQSDGDMTLQADFVEKLFLAGCEASHICQINDSHCKNQIIQTNHLFVWLMRWHICWVSFVMKAWCISKVIHTVI